MDTLKNVCKRCQKLFEGTFSECRAQGWAWHIGIGGWLCQECREIVRQGDDQAREEHERGGR